MEEKKHIVVNKDFLKGYDFVWVGLENLSEYVIRTEDVLDIAFEADLFTTENYSAYSTEDGFIKIAASAKDAIDATFTNNGKLLGTEWDTRFRERIEEYVDVTTLTFKKKGKKRVTVYVPYDPLLDVIEENEIELTNCPSLELDDEENMLICFGKSSKTPMRKDNDYVELIEGWVETFPDYVPAVLRAEVRLLQHLYCRDKFNQLVELSVKKEGASEEITLVFTDCQKLQIAMVFPKQGESDISMARMLDGRIFVGFDDLGIQFTCSKVGLWEILNRDGDSDEPVLCSPYSLEEMCTEDDEEGV